MSSEAAALPAWLDASADRLRRAWTAAAAVRPLYVVSGLLVVQWIAVLALALTVRHNGWLYYAGGDQLWHYSGAYVLAHGHVPPAYVGYGWSVLLAPIALFAGPNLVSALPVIVLGNTLVLLPLALLCVYGIAARIAGRFFGYFAAAVWIALPYLTILFVQPGYHQKYTELTLPQLLGLSSGPDFPAMVALLVSAYLCLRALDGSWYAAAGAGLAAGCSIAAKPSNSIFLVAPALLFLVERWRALLPFALGLAPALLTLALWKYRGLGEFAAAPAPAEPLRIAAGVGSLLDRVHDPNLNSWEHLHQVLLGLREHFWVARVIEWLPVAGALALLIRSRRGFLLIAGWFTIFLLVKGTYIPASVDDASFFRILMPAFPAYVLLAASLALLVPRVRARPAPPTFVLHGRRLAIAFGAAVVAFAVLPLGVVAATPRLHDKTHAVRFGNNLIPISSSIDVRATADGNGVRLSWRGRPPKSAKSFYHVLRAPGPQGGYACGGVRNDASWDCQLYMGSARVTRDSSYVDHPGPGNWVYRIGVAGNWLNDTSYGDVYVVSPPVTASVR
jgi:hypothetical protein